MCVASIAWDMHPRWRLVVGNRDEYHERPAAPLAKWDDGSRIIAGFHERPFPNNANRLKSGPLSIIGANSNAGPNRRTMSKDILPVDAFITRPLSICLDIVRAGAALAVLVFHAAQIRLYTGPFPKWPMAQHYAVVVFFVLSGLVIAASAQRRRTSLRDYALSRAARILPASVLSLAFATAAFAIATGLGAPPLHNDTYGELSQMGTLLPLLFLSESPFGAGPVWNPPYWSLCYEVWYYALFGIALFLRGPARLFWLMVAAALAGPKVLLMLPIWLVGVGLANLRAARHANALQGALLLAAGLAAAWLHTELVRPAAAVQREWVVSFLPRAGFSKFAISDLALAVSVAACFAGLRPLANRIPRLLESCAGPAQWLAGFSFTLYLFHWPLLNLLKSARVSAGESMGGFALLVLGLIGACYLISLVTERKRDVARAWLDALFRLRRAPAVA